jgi:hypothetical protein
MFDAVKKAQRENVIQQAQISTDKAAAKLNGHDPCRYLKDVLERLPTHPASRIEELLPHRWAAQ